jgi:hypothetical protein
VPGGVNSVNGGSGGRSAGLIVVPLMDLHPAPGDVQAPVRWPSFLLSMPRCSPWPRAYSGPCGPSTTGPRFQAAMGSAGGGQPTSQTRTTMEEMNLSLCSIFFVIAYLVCERICDCFLYFLASTMRLDSVFS